MQLINKTTGQGVFTSDDEDVMDIFLAIAGPILAESNLYEQIQGKSKGRGVEGTGGEVEMPASGGSVRSSDTNRTSSSAKKSLPKFSEGNEEEDD